jgi:hypothetical protein
VPVILVRFEKKLEFSGQIFEEYSNMKFHSDMSTGSRAVTCGRTDRHILRNLYSLFSNFAKAAKNMVYLPGIGHGLLGDPDRSLITVQTDIASCLRAKRCR